MPKKKWIIRIGSVVVIGALLIGLAVSTMEPRANLTSVERGLRVLANPFQHGILPDFCQQPFRSGIIAAAKIMGLGILTARTTMGTPLAEHHEADAGTVHNGFLDDSREAKLTHNRDSCFLT